MRLFIDCEFNSFKGDLISMALESEDLHHHFYMALPCDNPHPWVAEHVMPVLGISPVSMSEFQYRLQEFLMRFDTIHIIADWPEDIKHFCDALITGPGMRLDTPPLTMEVLRIDSVSQMPHNAMWDAIAIRDDVLAMESSRESRDEMSDEHRATRWVPFCAKCGGDCECDDWQDDDEADDDFDNCSMMPDGQCGQAGSEYCDFECPHRA